MTRGTASQMGGWRKDQDVSRGLETEHCGLVSGTSLVRVEASGWKDNIQRWRSPVGAAYHPTAYRAWGTKDRMAAHSHRAEAEHGAQRKPAVGELPIPS